MRWLARTLASLGEDVEFWLSLLGLLLIGSGILVTVLHAFGR
jgi:hypothetical protein